MNIIVSALCFISVFTVMMKKPQILSLLSICYSVLSGFEAHEKYPCLYEVSDTESSTLSIVEKDVLLHFNISFNHLRGQRYEEYHSSLALQIQHYLFCSIRSVPNFQRCPKVKKITFLFCQCEYGFFSSLACL